MEQFRHATPEDLKANALGIWLVKEQVEANAYTVVDGWVYFMRVSMFGPYLMHHLVETRDVRKTKDFLIPVDPIITTDYERYERIREVIIKRYKQNEYNLSHGERIVAAFIMEKKAEERVAKVESLL